ncbi:general stress protein [Alteribacter lacisalsi]|uniref:General stress protein n=1 Tax=Alteribacter lacisalsi TaxID=2045244 RepID=A0A2W0H744_9BACI|nr:general stress protein [Alteribacter lacisalsi]PYZ97674.1 general stress protein [Alteribacter lacisalsi]
MQPDFKLFENDQKAFDSVEKLKRSGVDTDNIYVLSHDKDHTKRVKKETEAEKIGVSETGLGTATKNVFRKTGDALRSKMNEIGIDKPKAGELEEELDEGKVLVIVTNQEEKVKF